MAQAARSSRPFSRKMAASRNSSAARLLNRCGNQPPAKHIMHGEQNASALETVCPFPVYSHNIKTVINKNMVTFIIRVLEKELVA